MKTIAQHVHKSTAEELAARLPDPVFAEATGVLEMIAKNPDECRLYNQRLKMERDERARNHGVLEKSQGRYPVLQDEAAAGFMASKQSI